MNTKYFKYIGFVIGFLSIVILALSYFIESVGAFFIGIFVLVLSILFIIFVMTVELYQKDKLIDYDLVKKTGLRIVKCANCEKENVLEDQYCRYCGQKLKE